MKSSKTIINDKIKELFEFFLESCSQKDKETFLALFFNEKSTLLAIDFLNCFLIQNKKPTLSDNSINFLKTFDIIKEYSPKKKKKPKKEK